MEFPDDDLPDDVLCAIADHVESKLIPESIAVIVSVYPTGRIEYRWASCDAYTAHLMDIIDNSSDDTMYTVLLDPIWNLTWNTRRSFDMQSSHRIVRLSTVFVNISSECDL